MSVVINEFVSYPPEDSGRAEVVYQTTGDLTVALGKAEIMSATIERSANVAVVLNVDHEDYHRVFVSDTSLDVLDKAIAALTEARRTLTALAGAVS